MVNDHPAKLHFSNPSELENFEYQENEYEIIPGFRYYKEKELLCNYYKCTCCYSIEKFRHVKSVIFHANHCHGR